MEKTQFNWKVAGFAGQGIMTTGLLLAKTCARQGLSVFDYTEYPSLIRGGHNTMQIKASSKKVYAQEKPLDLLIALNGEAVSLHLNELNNQTVILYDEEDAKFNPGKFRAQGVHYNVPFFALAKSVGAERLMANNVALGASVSLLGLKLEILDNVIRSVFADKSEAVVKVNQDSAHAGYEYVKEHFKPIATIKLEELKDKGEIILTGNEAIGLGAIAAGCKFYAAYPMTPASSILHYLASMAKTYQLVVKHAEDELSAVNQAIGASYAGVRSMTGTSGGGFALMVEGVSLAGITETPLVVIEAQRPGPGTGLPTWTSQGDLQFILRAGHGEFPKAVLTPGDVEEAFHLTRLAFEIAERYHTQVFVLTDKYLGESHASCPRFESIYKNQRYGFAEDKEKGASYNRYKDTQSGISPRALPGDPRALFLANSYEHDEYGLATESEKATTTQVAKRLRKLKGIASITPKPIRFGSPEAKRTLISWGSNKGPILSSLELLNQEGPEVNYIHFSSVWPFPSNEFLTLIEEAKRTILIECNATAQFGQLIRQETGIIIDQKLLKFDGRPFYPHEIENYVRSTT